MKHLDAVPVRPRGITQSPRERREPRSEIVRCRGLEGSLDDSVQRVVARRQPSFLADVVEQTRTPAHRCRAAHAPTGLRLRSTAPRGVEGGVLANVATAEITYDGIELASWEENE